jgi:hypothetical protein
MAMDPGVRDTKTSVNNRKRAEIMKKKRTKAELVKILERRAPEGRLACATAFRIAEEAGLSRKELGRLLNSLKIKVCRCQLGCF